MNTAPSPTHAAALEPSEQGGHGPALLAGGAGPESGPGPGRLWAYGALGAPLAWAALPLFVHWPAHAAAHWGLPLAGVGLLLLAVRLLDALLDPWVGHWADVWLARDARLAWQAMALGAGVLIAGLAVLFLLPIAPWPWPWLVAGLALLLTSGGYSLAQITHQAWGARMADLALAMLPQAPRNGPEPVDPMAAAHAAAQAPWVGARELAALGGVVAASLLPPLLGWGLSLLLLALVAVSAWWLLRWVMPSPAVTRLNSAAAPAGATFKPWQDRPLRSLMVVHGLNGLASAVPATLLVFYVQDALQAPQSQGLLLAAYFVAAAVAVPLWVKGVSTWGPVAAWGAAMVLAMAVFCVVPWLAPGAVLGFALVCVGTGVAAAGDAVAAQALLLSLPNQSNEGPGEGPGAGHPAGAQSGQRLGWWAMLSKLNLALAAGLALPLVVWAGYAQGDRSALSVTPLVWTYAALPCVLKCLAMVALLVLRKHWALKTQALVIANVKKD